MATPLSSNMPWDLANNIWAQALNPILGNMMIQGKMISGIALTASTAKVINHGLGRMMTGWWVVDNTANCTVWRTQNLNTKTITIESSADTTIALWVF